MCTAISKLTHCSVARRALFDKALQFFQHSWIRRSKVEARFSLHMLLQRRTEIDQQFWEVIHRHEVKRMLAPGHLHRPEKLSLALRIKLSAVRIEMPILIVHDRELALVRKQ
ncbi:hypothetical protein SN15_07320 [Stenotrophomonas maltophilia]|nr:hypothetical protein SN15_07320 [Stenotrophomonas maltophilia]